MSERRSKPDQYQLRFPPGLRDRLKKAADSRGRSMNAEIIARLEGSFRGWPKITLDEDRFERVRKAPVDQRVAMEAKIESYVHQVVDAALPASHTLHRDLSNAFYRLLSTTGPDDREALAQRFQNLLMEMHRASHNEPEASE